MIKHGVRVKSGTNRVPRQYLLRRITQRPTLRSSAPQETSAASPAPDSNYSVVVTYSTQTGAVTTFQGSFLARNAQLAEERARSFINRYVRPQRIDAVVAVPIVS